MASIGSAPNSKVVLMPMEASSLIGSLGGIGAIAREVFGDGSQGQAEPRRNATPRSTPSVNPLSRSES